MNYLIGTSMRLGISATFILIIGIFSSCVFEALDDTKVRLLVENDTNKLVEIVGFPNPTFVGSAFRDTVKIAPAEIFNFVGQDLNERPIIYDSVRIYWGGEFQRTDTNSTVSPPPSFFSVWVLTSCGKYCNKYSLKISELLPEKVE